jgi:hypothetical protein
VVSFDLAVRTRASLHTDGDPDQFVSRYDATILCADEAGDERTVGRVRGLKVHAGVAANHREALFDVCDCHSQELHDLYTLLYEPGTHHFREHFRTNYEAYDCDLLVLDYVVLSPKWRGLKLGLLAARRFVDLVGGGCGLVASQISPLRRDAHRELRVPERWLPADGDGPGHAARLRRHFRRMGFERLGRTPYYVLPTALKTPTGQELLQRGRSE